MCMGIPMQVTESGPARAICDFAGELRRIDTMLVGEQPVGTWLLVFIDAAREVISEEDAMKITDALRALSSVSQGTADSIDHLFADIIEGSASNQKETG